jgi:hypothetical protein
MLDRDAYPPGLYDARQVKDIFDTFGKFPGTAPGILVLAYLRAHHPDCEIYDRFFERGACLRPHARHTEQGLFSPPSCPTGRIAARARLSGRRQSAT